MDTTARAGDTSPDKRDLARPDRKPYEGKWLAEGDMARTTERADGRDTLRAPVRSTDSPSGGDQRSRASSDGRERR